MKPGYCHSGSGSGGPSDPACCCGATVTVTRICRPPLPECVLQHLEQSLAQPEGFLKVQSINRSGVGRSTIHHSGSFGGRRRAGRCERANELPPAAPIVTPPPPPPPRALEFNNHMPHHLACIHLSPPPRLACPTSITEHLSAWPRSGRQPPLTTLFFHPWPDAGLKQTWRRSSYT